MIRLTIIFLFLLSNAIHAQGLKSTDFIFPGQLWQDSKGSPINAHGGAVIFHDGIYYWHGTHKIPGLSEKEHADGGIHCYASKDLITWYDHGQVLFLTKDDPHTDLAHESNFDRPKIVFNAKTKNFVAFFKLYLKDHGVETGFVGVALSKSPSGPFVYSHKFLGGNSPNGTGDFAIFQEENGDLYHLTVRKPDKAFVVGKLREDYLMPEGLYQVCKGILKNTEAPAVIKRKGTYHMLASGSSGWDPNPARYYTSASILGPWEYHGNPCTGINPLNGLGPEKTWGGQSTAVVKVAGLEDAWIAMFDINKPEHPFESLHIWLPVTLQNDLFTIPWRDSWNLGVFGK